MKDLSTEQASRYHHAIHSLDMWEEALLCCTENDFDVFDFYVTKCIFKMIELYIIEQELSSD